MCCGKLYVTSLVWRPILLKTWIRFFKSNRSQCKWPFYIHVVCVGSVPETQIHTTDVSKIIIYLNMVFFVVRW